MDMGIDWFMKWNYSIGMPLRCYQVNAVKFNEYASVVVSAGYDRSLRAWDCRSQSTEPIQVPFFKKKDDTSYL